MAIEFLVHLENRPGTLAELCEGLGAAGVNIVALEGMAHNDEGIVRFVVDDPKVARSALETADIEFSSREVISVKVLDEPGTLADVARVMYEAGINIDAVYVTTGGRLILGVDDLQGAREVASGLDVYG